MKTHQKHNGEQPRSKRHQLESIFVIDDDEIMLEVVVEHLVTAGFPLDNIHKFSSPTEAIEIIRFVKPSLIITDIHMPSLSGAYLAKLIQMPEFNNAPVIAITGDEDFKLNELTINSGICDVVYKPFDGNTLVSAVTSTLEWADRKREAYENHRKEKGAAHNRTIRKQEQRLRKLFGK